MRRIASILLFLLCTSCNAVWAQHSWQHYYDILAENSEEDKESLQLIYEALSEAADNPLNINTITTEQLRTLLCFSDEQTERIVGFVNRYGPLRSKGELMMIPYLDDALSGLLMELTYIGESKEKDFTYLDSLNFEKANFDRRHTFNMQENRGSIATAAHIPLYSRKGDGNGYNGSKIKHWLRANYKIDRNISIGMVASQDAGEPFFTNRNRQGYDFYSGYIKMQRLGIMKSLVIGRYRMRSGMGLILNNDLSFGKSFSTMNLGITGSTTILPHSSRTEGNYMQGVAGTIGLTKQIEISAFASYRTIDATLTDNADAIKTIVKTGYHRTESEMLRRHNATQATAGAVIRFTHGKLSSGFNAVYNHFSLPLQPVTEPIPLSQLYRKFAPAGQDFWNLSIDYGYKIGKELRLHGETGTDGNHRIATVNTISWQPHKTLTLRAIQRFYPFMFNTIMGQSFSEGGSNQDESGVYVGGEWTPTPRLSLTAYADIAYFAWPKYQALGASHSFDNMLQVIYKLSANTRLNMRYRIKLRQKDADTKAGYNPGDLIYKDEQRLRVQLLIKNGHFDWKSQVDAAFCKYRDTSIGAMASQTVGYSSKGMKISSGIGYFRTKDYDSRVYAYEQSTPYNLSFPAFYGHGCRAYCVGEASIMNNFLLIAKIGFTKYFDRDEIGSGLQLISSSHQTDLDFTLRYTIK